MWWCRYYSRCTAVEVEWARRAVVEQSSRVRLKLFLACEGANAVISYAGRPVSGLDRPPTHQTRGARPGSSLFPRFKSQLVHSSRASRPKLPCCSTVRWYYTTLVSAPAPTSQRRTFYRSVPSLTGPHRTVSRCCPPGEVGSPSHPHTRLKATWPMSHQPDVRFLSCLQRVLSSFEEEQKDGQSQRLGPHERPYPFCLKSYHLFDL